MKPSAQLSTDFLKLHKCLCVIHYTSALHSIASVCNLLGQVLMMEFVPSELCGRERKERKICIKMAKEGKHVCGVVTP